MDLAKTEAMLFKFGSGAGSNLSTIRSSKEKMTGGGTASGPVSFMKGYDAFAGVVKSGGKTRRAAKMVILDAGHPDVIEFIDSKLNEEKKAWALIEAGYDPSFTGEAYGIGLLPERQPQRPRDGRVHATPSSTTATGRPTTSTDNEPMPTPTRPRTSSARWRRRPTSAATPASSTTRRSTTGTRRRTRIGSTRPTRAPSTCSSTTRPATWPAST